MLEIIDIGGGQDFPVEDQVKFGNIFNNSF
jgi:hypothetical protein